tara:strand:- start:697 stop:1452 length:756 start_codon:yes stop_codon:yes gene_type:complete
MIYKYVSIKTVLGGLMRDYNHQEDINVWDVVEWAAEALDFIGAHGQYELLYEDLSIAAYKAALPCGFHSLEQISYKGVPLSASVSVMEPATSINSTNTNIISGKEVDKDNFPLDTDTINALKGATYYINDSYLIVSFETGCVTMAYKGVPVDKEGLPKIPDNVYYIKAIKAYCQMMLDRQAWRAQRVPAAVFQESQQEWNFMCVGARGAANMPNLDKMESIKRQWVRLKPNMNSYNSFFKDLNIPEQIKNR